MQYIRSSDEKVAAGRWLDAIASNADVGVISGDIAMSIIADEKINQINKWIPIAIYEGAEMYGSKLKEMLLDYLKMIC